MNRKLVSLFVLGMALSASSAVAAPYGTAGCGVGALVFKDQPGKIQIVAATLNNIISPQTSAITSGTSNCYEEDTRAAAAMYVTINEQALKNDIARGNGETIVGLSKILGCSDSEMLGTNLQKNMKSIFPTSGTPAADAAKSIEAAIQNDEKLAKSCRIG